MSDLDIEQVHAYTFDFEGKQMLESSHTLWQHFSFETQKRWLSTFITEDRSECLSCQLNKVQWTRINKRYPAIKALLGFADKSGPNCFATTLAGFLDIEKAKNVAALWMQTETFLRVIKESGYHRTQLEANNNIPDASILLFHNEGELHHACLYLGEGLVFNKDAQSWFAPKQILALETLLENWNDCSVSVYVK